MQGVEGRGEVREGRGRLAPVLPLTTLHVKLVDSWNYAQDEEAAHLFVVLKGPRAGQVFQDYRANDMPLLALYGHTPIQGLIGDGTSSCGHFSRRHGPVSPANRDPPQRHACGAQI